MSTIKLNLLGSYATNISGKSAAEIAAYDPTTKRLFVVNAHAPAVDVLDISDASNPTKLFEIDPSDYGDGANSVAVSNGIVAIAIESDPKTDPGKVVFFNTDGEFLKEVNVGSLPDMLVFTPDGTKVLVANEGEPNGDYTIDPEGSISIIDISGGIENLSQANVATVDFTAFDNQSQELIDSGVRIFGPNATVAQDLEPEYIAVSGDSSTAYVALQENNAIAVVDITNSIVTNILPLGYKDHSVNSLDASDRDDSINITNYANLYGIYQPDAIAAYETNGQTYIVTSNEGDARDYAGFKEEARLKDLILDRDAFPNARDLQRDQNLGRLTITTTKGISNNKFFKSQLSGDQETTPVTTEATGTAVLKLNDDATALSYEARVTGLDFGSILGLDAQTPDTADDVTGLHIHTAPAGQNGPVVFNILSNPDSNFTINEDGSTTLTGIWDDLANFATDLGNAETNQEVDLYFNVHTVANPSGEIRGQLTSTPAYNELYAFGGRSFSIWDTQGNLVYDSGAEFEQKISQLFPNDFDDTRSDNKGPEPEGVTIGEVNDRTYAFITLERTGGVMTYDITNPAEAFFVDYVNNRDTDISPEGVLFIPPDSPNQNPLVAVANEVSGTTSLFEVTTVPYTLQLFHFADQEAGIPAFDDAPRFSAVLNALKAQDIDNDGVPGSPNTLILSSGDAYIPGLFFSASETPYGALGRGDILIQNALGVQAIAFGNHEFDLGTQVIKNLIASDEAASYPGTAFPYLSSNLDFSTDSNLADLVVDDDQASLPNSIAASVFIDVNGEKIGVVGATTPTLRVISSPGNVTVNPSPFNGNPTPEQLDALAGEIQADVDALLTANPDLNKVVLLAHMQQLFIEQELATRLRHVDIIVAGGSNTRLLDNNDRLRSGDTNQGTYPTFKTDADGKPVAVVNTDGNYKYVGRLVVDFDANGVIIPDSYDPDISGAYATDAQGVADLGAENLVNPEVQAVVDSLREIVVQQESNVFGISTVYLNGDRSSVRRQETNLGNLTADANLAIAKQTDPEVVISLKNGGGIRNSIGRVVVPTGSTGNVERLPNEAVVDSDGDVVKPTGGISENDIANALSFNNGLTLITVTATELLALVEHAVASTTVADTTTPGAFPQIAGFSFSFDPREEPGNRVLSLAIEDENGRDLDVLVRDGEIVGDPNRSFRMVTLNYLAGGGDGYPFPTGETANRVDLAQPEEATRTGEANFVPDGTEQDALAEYLFDNFLITPFGAADTTRDLDSRIQNLAFQEDTVISPPRILSGSAGDDNQTLTSADTGLTVFTGNGDDQIEASETAMVEIHAGDGNDTVFISSQTYVNGGAGDDMIFIGTTSPSGNSLANGGTDRDTLIIIEASESNILLGGADDDELEVAQGRDQLLFGGSDRDFLRSSAEGHNRLYAGSGDDVLYSQISDRLFGGDGNDQLYAGEGGDNQLWGGTGEDEFWLVVGGSLPNALNVVKDFQVGTDRIRMGSITADQVSLVNQNNHTLIQVDSSDVALLEMVNPTQLDVNNPGQFLFA